MATTYGMTAPMMSSTMPNPMGTVQTAMAPSMMGQSPMGMNSANMNLPLSTARPIEVTETTPNLEQIQNFPVAGRAADGTHFHQDPVSGQMYRMSAEFHDRIPQILADRTSTANISMRNFGEISSITLDNDKILPTAPKQPVISINNNAIQVDVLPSNEGSYSIYNVFDDQKKIYSKIVDFRIGTFTRNTIPNTGVDKSPINVINNGKIIDVSVISSNYYKPTNLFLNTSYSQFSSMYGVSYFVPINKFINR